MFKPSFPFTTAMMILKPVYVNTKGVTNKTYTNTGDRINGSFKTYGGTETTENDVYSVLNTAWIETWYRPDITSDCRIKILATGQIFEIIGKPENINLRNQFMKFKVESIEGDA